MSFSPVLSFRRQGRFLLLVVLLVLAGCASNIELEFGHDPERNFSNFQTYAWYDRTSAPNQVAYNRIRKAVDIVLYKKGFRYAEVDREPDFRVGFTAVGEAALPADEVSARMDYGNDTWRPPVDPNIPPRKYTRGTIIVDVIDPVEGELLWRGVGSRSLDEGLRSQSLKEEYVLETVRAILEQFPPRPE
ncbi:MAG: DUF4136 domain-containing protein [Gammaproteobacteria bacterium]|nr:DUF4136 domain-containing protein [Gammaproteobacteria bacterium]